MISQNVRIQVPFERLKPGSTFSRTASGPIFEVLTIHRRQSLIIAADNVLVLKKGEPIPEGTWFVYSGDEQSRSRIIFHGEVQRFSLQQGVTVYLVEESPVPPSRIPPRGTNNHIP